MKINLIILITLIISNISLAQEDYPTKKVKKLLDAKKIVWDKYNQDGVLKAKSKKNGRWKMYQYFYDGKRPKTLNSSSFDSLGFYTHTSKFTIVKKKDKYGILGYPWGREKASLNVKCIYEKIRYVEESNKIVAAKGKTKWAYINAENGDTLIPFYYDEFKDLPEPNKQIIKYPMQEYPEKIIQLLNNPDTVTIIDLRGLGLTFIPNEINKCVNATYANLESNNLAELPDGFFDLTKLETLYLGNNSEFTDFDERFAKLKNLKTFVIGHARIGGYSRYSGSSFSFSKELKHLNNLKDFELSGSFYKDDISKFIYDLPNLKKLSLNSIYYNRTIDIDFEKLKCRDSLEYLNIETLKDFSNMNKNMKLFTNLQTVDIITYNHKQIPLWINDLKSLKKLNIKYHVPRKDKENSDKITYYTESVIPENSWWNHYKEIENEKDKQDAINQWKKFINENVKE